MLRLPRSFCLFSHVTIQVFYEFSCVFTPNSYSKKQWRLALAVNRDRKRSETSPGVNAGFKSPLPGNLRCCPTGALSFRSSPFNEGCRATKIWLPGLNRNPNLFGTLMFAAVYLPVSGET